MLTEVQIEKLVDLFYEDISETPWDVWCDTSSGDKERIVPEAVVKLNDPTVDIDEVYDLFWSWTEGLEEDDFKQDPNDDLDDEEDWLYYEFGYDEYDKKARIHTAKDQLKKKFN